LKEKIFRDYEILLGKSKNFMENKKDFIFKENETFLKKGWRNKLFKHRPPSVPQNSIPFSNKETLYELIKEQNSQELMNFNPKHEKREHQEKHENQEKIQPNSAFIKRLRIKKPRNIDLDMENLSKSQEIANIETFEEKKSSVLKNPLEKSYRDKIQNIETEIIKEKTLEKNLRKLRISRFDAIDILIEEARNRENQRIQQIMQGIKLKNPENLRFHNEIREKFDKYGNSRVEIDKTFAVFTETIRNLEFFRDFTFLYKSPESCSHKTLNKKKNLGKSKEKARSFYEKSQDFFFTMKIQRLDSHKSRIVLTLDKNQELSFVTGENCENFIKFNTKKPEFSYFGNDSHDKSLLLELERKLLQDLKLQRQKTQLFIKKSELNENLRPETPSFSQRKDKSIEILLNLDIAETKNKEKAWNCEICDEINKGFSRLFTEIFKRDRGIENEFSEIDANFKGFIEEKTGFEGLIGKIAERFRNVVRSCFKILPNHAFFFEKCFKILAFLQETIILKNQATVSQLLSEIRH